MRHPGRTRRRCRAAVLALALLSPLPAAAGAEPVTIFAAASTTDAMTEIAELYEERSGQALRTVFAASSTLARQIAQGAPADLYLSANPRWMDHLESRALIVPGSRRDLLGNSLVLIAPAAAPARIEIAPGLDLPSLLGDRPLALADPDHVPAGIYAVEALGRLGAWPLASGRAAYTANVRAALALVDRGEAAAGIVYATDAAIAPRVRVLGTFPPDSHTAIRYPLAMIAGKDKAETEAFHAFLQGPEAAARFRARGFILPGAGF